MCDKNSIDIKRFQELMDNSGKTRPTIAKDLGCDTSTITKHYNGDRGVTTDYLIKYAKYFNVSADYLLGLSNAKPIEPEIQDISKYTGLNDQCLSFLHSKNGAFYSDIINFLFDSDNVYDFSRLCLYANEYRNLYSQYVTFREKMSEEFEQVYIFKSNNPNEFDDEYDKAAKQLQEIEDKRDVRIMRIHEVLKQLIDKYCADLIDREKALMEDDELLNLDDVLDDEGD